MAEQEPFEQYLEDVQAHLGGLAPEQRERVLRELQQHLDDAAQHAGTDPHDPLFQVEQIDRLGPSRQLGRAMVRAHRSPVERQQRLNRLVGGGAVLVSMLLLIAAGPAAMTLRNSQVLMSMVRASPAALIPTMLVLHLIYRPLRPRLSRWALICGTLGMLTLSLVTVYHDILELVGLHDTIWHRPIDVLQAWLWVSWLLVSLIGVWFILIGRLNQATGVPDIPAFGLVSILTGESFLLFPLWIAIYQGIIWVTGTAPPIVQTAFSWLFFTTTFIWSSFHLGWGILAAIWLLQRRAPPPAQVA
jgi:hypothetical protein